MLFVITNGKNIQLIIFIDKELQYRLKPQGYIAIKLH